MTDSMGPGKLVRHMQNLSYTYDIYLICMGLGPSISSVMDKSLSYSGPSYPSLSVLVSHIIDISVLEIGFQVLSNFGEVHKPGLSGFTDIIFIIITDPN